MPLNPQYTISPNALTHYSWFLKVTSKALSHLYLIAPVGEEINIPSISPYVSSQFLDCIELEIILPSDSPSFVPSHFPFLHNDKTLVRMKSVLSQTSTGGPVAPVVNKVHISSRSLALLSPLVPPFSNRFYKKTRERGSALGY
mmetsp:Transcript_147/g.368  ORF Transcript_147/g.368 Transcript_147/m.368 type:complete len:143 (+) Transcript_147:2973-3401(+)